jgi:hypothetical protein
VGTEEPATTATYVTAMSSASNKAVANLASASSCQTNALLTTIQCVGVITKHIPTHVRPPFKEGRPSTFTVNATVVTGIRAIGTQIVKAISTASFQTEIVTTVGGGEYVRPFLLERTVMAIRIIKCAVVITSSTRIHAKPTKAAQVFKTQATAAMKNSLLSKSLTCIMSGVWY